MKKTLNDLLRKKLDIKPTLGYLLRKRLGRQGGVSMSCMSNLDYEINELHDTTRMSCEQIAESLHCPIEFVHDVVQYRWEETTA